MVVVASSTFHNSDGLHADTTTRVKLVRLSPSTTTVLQPYIKYDTQPSVQSFLSVLSKDHLVSRPWSLPDHAGIIRTVSLSLSLVITDYSEESCKEPQPWPASQPAIKT